MICAKQAQVARTNMRAVLNLDTSIKASGHIEAGS